MKPEELLGVDDWRKFYHKEDKYFFLGYLTMATLPGCGALPSLAAKPPLSNLTMATPPGCGPFVFRTEFSLLLVLCYWDSQCCWGRKPVRRMTSSMSWWNSWLLLLGQKAGQACDVTNVVVEFMVVVAGAESRSGV
jgi:hypothetical protein